MSRFSHWFNRRFRGHDPRKGLKPPTRHHADNERHACFKTPAGRGPFLLSYDGRVIPLRKARFLQD